MTLDPDAAAILERVREAGVPPWHTLPPVEGRRVYRERALLLADPPIPVGSVWDDVIPTPAGPLGTRAYRPAGGGPHPILLYLHGGGWVLGDLDTHDAVCRRLSLAADCLVVSLDYRLAPEHPYPAAMDDVVAAMRWLAAHGSDLGGDPTRLAIGGDSAGGTLAAGAVLRLRDEGGPPVALQALVYPATEPRFELPSFHENAEGYLLTTADVAWFWDQYLGGDEAATTDPYACPGVGTDLTRLPAAVVITAEFDPLRDDGDGYAERLRAAGVPVTARCFPGMIHGFVALPIEIPAGREAIDLIASAAREAWATG